MLPGPIDSVFNRFTFYACLISRTKGSHSGLPSVGFLTAGTDIAPADPYVGIIQIRCGRDGITPPLSRFPPAPVNIFNYRSYPVYAHIISEVISSGIISRR